MQSNPSCPNCTRTFRGLQGQGPQERSHDRASLLPLLLRCGHTFCSGCLGKLVKIQKTNITCPQCQVNTPMPFGEASLKSLPPDYYRLGQVLSNYKQLNDLIHQKMDTSAKPTSDKLKYEGKLLKACPGRELCQECCCVLATCSCRQCGNAVMCDPCFDAVHCGSKMMQSHIQRPFTKDRCIAKCPDHGEEEKYFCSQDDVAICGHCAIIGNHKGHAIVPISEQTKEAFNELPTALDKGVASLKKLYFAKQTIHKAKLDTKKETGHVLEAVSSTFASQISLLQMRSHHILEIVHNNCTDQLDRLTEMEENIVSNIAILEGIIEDASYTIKTENDTDSNLLRMLETLTSTDLPCHYVTDEGKPPMAAFTFDKEFTAKIINFGNVGVDSTSRGDLKSENELPDDYEQTEINDDILQKSNAFKTDKKGALKIKALSMDNVPQENPIIDRQDSSQRTPASTRSAHKGQRSSGGSDRSSTGSLSPHVTSPREIEPVPHREPGFYKSTPGFSRTRGTTPPKGGATPATRGITPPKRKGNYGVMADPKIELSPYGQSDDSVFVPSESWLRDEDTNKAAEEEQAAAAKVKAESARARSTASSHNRGYDRVRSPQRPQPFQPETKALVRLVHIRNPCYFFVQREADALELGNLMARINSECNHTRESQRKPEKIEPGVMCCAKYLDGRWYRAKIKRIMEPTSPKKPDKTDDKQKSKRKKSSQSSDAESSKDGSEDKDEDEEENKEEDGEKSHDVEDGEDKEGSTEENSSETTKTKKSEDSKDSDVDVEVSSVHSAKSSQSTKSSRSTKSSHSQASEARAPSSSEAVSEPIVEVLYVDFGNTEIVTVSKLCKLRPKLSRFPEMAVCCSLTDIVPNNYEVKWTTEVNQGFARIVGQSIVQMSIQVIIMEGEYYGDDTSVQASAGTLLYVDLHKLPNEEVENDMPVSLRDALVFLELACFRTPESLPKDLWHHNRSYLGADLPKSGDSISATISHINNPGNFYVQEIGDDMQYLLDMMKDLQVQYKKRGQEKWGILCPQIGMICTAKFELDQQWYRAQIIGLPGKQRVEVLYVDYGNLANVHFSDLRKVTSQFLKLPVQALPCSLADVEPTDNATDGWPEYVAGEFFGLVAQKSLKVFVKSVKDNCLSAVLLYEEEDEEKEKCANAELVRNGHAKSTGPSSTVLPFGTLAGTPSTSNNNKPLTNGSVLPSGALQHTAHVKKKKQESKTGSTASPGAAKSKPETSKKANIYTKVHVSHIESPACIYVQLASAGKDGLDSLLESTTLHYKDSEQQEDGVWQEGDICCALLVRENVWCRARIKTVLPDDKAVVLFSDYGNTEIIELSNVRPLVERFQQQPPFAIQCHLADVIPAGDKQKWTKTACEFLIAKLADLECCIVKKGELVAGSLPIDLLYEMSIEEKVERETVEDLFSISKLLKQKGLAFAPRKRNKSRSSTSPSGRKSPAKTSPKSAAKTSSHTVPKPTTQTAPESNVVLAEPTAPAVNSVSEPKHQHAEESNNAKNAMESSQGNQNNIKNGAEITQDALQVAVDAGTEITQDALQVTVDAGTEITQDALQVTVDASTFIACRGQEGIKLEPPALFETPPESPQDALQTAKEDKSEVVEELVNLAHDAFVRTQDALVRTQDALVSSPKDVPTKHAVSAVQKIRDPAMQPLPASGDSDSDFLSDAGDGDNARRMKKKTSPSKLAEEKQDPMPEKPSVEEEDDELPITDFQQPDQDIANIPPVDPVDTKERLSPPVVVLDSSNNKDAIAYKPCMVPSTDTVQLVITYVDADGIIYGVHVDAVDKLQKLVAKLQAEMASRPPSTDVSFYKGQAVCANFTQDGLWYRAKVLGGTQQGVKVQYIDFGNTEIAASDKIQPIAFEPDIPQKSQGCKLIDLYPMEPHTQWPQEIIKMLLESLVEQTCTIEIKSLCVEDKPWKVDLKLPDGQSLSTALLNMGYARQSRPSDSPSSESVESEEETADGSSGISSSVVSSSVMSSDVPQQNNSNDVVTNTDPYQIVNQEIVADCEDENNDKLDISRYCLAGSGIEYNCMRLPQEGVYFGAQVTQVDRPDLLYIQIVPSPAGNSDPTVHRSAEELYLLGELIKELNQVAPNLPRLPTTSIRQGQVCCALYELDLQYYRGKVVGVRDHGEKLVQVQYVDYGNSEWHSPDSLRQMPDKFVNLPAQARQCKIVGIKPPQTIPEGDTLLQGTNWPVSSGRRMVELVNDKQLVVVVKYDAAVPGIHLFESASQTPLPDPQPADGMSLHVTLVSDDLAEFDSEEEEPEATNVPDGQESEV